MHIILTWERPWRRGDDRNRAYREQALSAANLGCWLVGWWIESTISCYYTNSLLAHSTSLLSESAEQFCSSERSLAPVWWTPVAFVYRSSRQCSAAREAHRPATCRQCRSAPLGLYTWHGNAVLSSLSNAAAVALLWIIILLLAGCTLPSFTAVFRWTIPYEIKKNAQ